MNTPGGLRVQIERVAAAAEGGGEAALIACLVAEVALCPESGAMHAALGLLQLRGGALEPAIDHLEVAAALLPGEALPHALLGAAYMATMRRERAVACYRLALACNPALADVENNLGAALIGAYRFQEAADLLANAAERREDDTESPLDVTQMINLLCNLGVARSALGDSPGAIAAIERALALDPRNPTPRRALCGALPYREGITGAAMRSSLEEFVGCLPAPQPVALTNDPDPGRRLRVGILSNYLKTHPVGWLTVAGIEALDRQAFDIQCFGNRIPEDRFAQRFAAISSAWHAIEAPDDPALAASIRAAGVDILIDCGGYGDAGRLAVCRHRAAPVQVKWVGSQFHGTGLPEIDGFITDVRETPPGFERFYTEPLLRLPDGYVCYAPPGQAPDVAPPPARRNGFITFGCLNNLMKIGPGVLDAWASILHEIPASRLLLRATQLSEAPAPTRILAEFAARGIEASRLTLLGRAPHAAYIGTYGEIDIALDPFPYSGGLSTCEALFMGVPVITLEGEIFAARHSVSHIGTAGLSEAEFVAASVQDYIAKAVALARSPDRLATLRLGLRAKLVASPLCDAPRFGRNLGDALRRLWSAWCETQRGS